MALNKIDSIQMHKTISNDRSISREKERVSNYQRHLNTKDSMIKRKGNIISISSSPHKHSTRSTSIKNKDISSAGNFQLNDNAPMRKQQDKHQCRIDQACSAHNSKMKTIQNALILNHKKDLSESSIKVNSFHKEKSVKYKQTSDINLISVQKTITKNASNDYLMSSPSEKKTIQPYNTNSNSNTKGSCNMKPKNTKYSSSTISSIQTDRPMISNSNKRSSSLKVSTFYSARKGQQQPSILSTASKSPNHSHNSFTQIKIRLLSNWGNSEFIGLKEIFLQDNNKKRIQVIKCKVINGKQNNIYNLFNVNSSYSSMRKNAMWISPFNIKEYKSLILEVYFTSTNILQSITLSNYCGKDKTIGVKDIEILNENGIMRFKLQLPQARDINQKSIQINLEEAFKDDIKQYSIKKIVVNRKPYQKQNDQMAHGSSLIKSAANFTIVNIKSLEDYPIMNDYDNDNYNENEENQIMIKSKTITSINPLLGKYINYNANCSLEEKSIECQRIRITLLSNHGHHKHIGLTNLKFFNDKNELINIQTKAKEVKAIPRDIATYLKMKMDKRKFENIFNDIHQTIDDRYMWLTKLNSENDDNEPNAYIEISFKEKIRLSKVVFSNFNSPKHLDKGVKTALMELYSHPNDKQPISEAVFYLHKGLGYEFIDYSQELAFPFKEHILSEEELMPFYQVNFMLSIPEQQYHTPYLPSGFVVTVQLLTNYGHNSLIGVQSIELYDQLGKDILSKTKFSIGFYPLEESTKKPMVLKYINVKLKDEDNYECSVIVYVFNDPISLSYVKIQNGFIEDDATIGVKDIKILIDDFIIFEGTILSNENKDESKETTLAFTGDNAILKDVDRHSLTKNSHHHHHQ